jgi:hypothetical protein
VTAELAPHIETPQSAPEEAAQKTKGGQEQEQR